VLKTPLVSPTHVPVEILVPKYQKLSLTIANKKFVSTTYLQTNLSLVLLKTPLALLILVTLLLAHVHQHQPVHQITTFVKHGSVVQAGPTPQKIVIWTLVILEPARVVYVLSHRQFAVMEIICAIFQFVTRLGIVFTKTKRAHFLPHVKLPITQAHVILLLEIVLMSM